MDAQVAQWKALIVRAATAHPPVTPSLLAGLVQEESGGNPNAVSRTGAQGLTQLEPATAAGLSVTSPFDPLQNLLGGAHYLQMQYKTFGNWTDALIAYNGGPAAVANPTSGERAYAANVLALARGYVAWDAPVAGGTTAPKPSTTPTPAAPGVVWVIAGGGLLAAGAAAALLALRPDLRAQVGSAVQAALAGT